MDEPSASQLLRLLRAFMQVKDPAGRQLILRITEAAARGAVLKTAAPPNDEPVRMKLN